MKAAFMAHRVASALAGRRGGYRGPDELLTDLRLLQSSLRENGAPDEAEGPLEDLVRTVETFGFHLASLDLRLNARDVGTAVARILASSRKVPRYESLAEAEKVRLLTRLLESPGRTRVRAEGEGARVLDALCTMREIQDRYGSRMMDGLVLSMVSEPSDVLEVLLLAKGAGLVDLLAGASRVDIVPLFETRRDLESCGTTMAALYGNPAYRRHVELRGGRQEVMIGYSDSMKGSGIFASRWALYRAQRGLATASREAGVDLTIFHGRGGSVSRGGEPAHQAVRGLPPHAPIGRLKITEQGEILTFKYFHGSTALRFTEQLVSGLLFALGEPPKEPEPDWTASMDRMAEASFRAYRELIEDPSLPAYFAEASPIHEIAELHLGSRPASRKGTLRIEDLRAIPWVFAWTQTRHLLPGWYGVGTALDSEEDRALLHRMAGDWPYFRAVLDMVQMVLLKTDMEIARRYADLVAEARARRRIFGRIRDEHDRTIRQILEAAEARGILDSNPELQASIARRGPYIDALSYIQAALLERKRRLHKEDPDLLKAILLTITGIAHGLRNTG